MNSLPILPAILALAAATVHGIEPADPDLIPEARAVLNYLESVYGQHCLGAANGSDNAGFVYETSGRLPAIVSFDLSGWNSPAWGRTYTPVVSNTIKAAQDWWARGGIVAMQFHWKNPAKPDGSAWVGKHGNGPPSGPFDMAAATQPDTEAHRQFFSDLGRHADYLQKLAEAHVPVLWRPFHEIDGGWFWWTDQDKPENTAQLWRMMFDYLVRERKLHNLIWVYNPGVQCGGYKKLVRAKKAGESLAEEIAFRQRYYPGATFVDLAGIDIYPNKTEGYGEPVADTFPKAMEIMRLVAPGKMQALCESSFVANPERMAKQGPRWLYSLQWFEGDPAYTRATYNHAFLVTLDELPKLNPGPVRPFVQLTAPVDGDAVAGEPVELRAESGRRTDDIAKVEFLALSAPWKNWWMMQSSYKRADFSNATVLATVTAKPFAATWRNPPAGLHNLMARVTGRDGAVEYSNVARISAGLANLARSARISASSKSAEAARAVDGNLFTAWGGEKEGEQWLAADLGAQQTIGAVSISWWKAYAKAYRIQVSSDGANWRDVFATDRKSEFLGNTDLIRFDPVQSRHVRLLCTKQGADWGGYSVYEFGIHPPISP